jgi:hypothetical protein
MRVKFAARHLVCAGLLIALVAVGCEGERPTAPAPAAPKAGEPDAPKGDAIADPVLREAREQLDMVLTDLLTGKFDQDESFAPVARKLKGYQSWSIKSQQLVRDGAVNFRGILTAPGGRARFDIHFVKQESGKWAIGTFGGPNPE